jgi:hypothetical protein
MWERGLDGRQDYITTYEKHKINKKINTYCIISTFQD